jgi:hypothetical protein
MTPILHRTSKEYRNHVRRKLAAYHRYYQLGCIAKGLLQYLALYFRRVVWVYFRSRVAYQESGSTAFGSGSCSSAAKYVS